MYSELLGKLSALTVFVGFNLTFFPQFVLGYLGMPRRYYEYSPEYPGVERDVDGRCIDPGRGLRIAACLSACSRYGSRPTRARTPGEPRAWSGRPSRRRPSTTSTRYRS